MKKTKTLLILGSTGSIGRQSIDVAEKQGYKVDTIAAGSNYRELELQARKLSVKSAALFDEDAAKKLKENLADTDIKVYGGESGIEEAIMSSGADTAVNAIVGLAGLKPTLSCIRSKKKLALANKETLVAGGDIVKAEAKKYGVDILPVDSEHSAIFQCLQGQPPERRLKKIILTASGGPFFGMKKKDLENVTIKQALKNPNWSMGAKITVDSASMFNKGLELIEAVRLFDVSYDMVKIVVHRESIVHSAVMYEDNAVIAQLGLPDMRIPIQYALTYPDRCESPVGELDLASLGKLTFFEPDYDTFECISICKNAIKEGGLMPAAVNSANEEANSLFREGKIKFTDIPVLIKKASEPIENKYDFDADDIFSIDKSVRENVRRLV